MSARIAPVADFNIGLISDRQPHHRQYGRQPALAEGGTEDHGARPVEAERGERHDANSPTTGYDEHLPEGMLFTVALLANTAPRPVRMEEVILQQSHDWMPPISDLRLADKKI